MRILLFIFLLLWQVVTPSVGLAQCIGLDDLLVIGAEPTALTVPQVVTSRLSPDWTFSGPTATSREVFWTLPATDGGALSATRLQMRAQRPGQDVVLKTTQAACVRQLRAELKSRKLTAQPVTCPSCEAIRYQAPDFEVTIYSQMKGDYPFVVVVHQVLMVPATGPAGSGAKAAPSVIHPVDIAMATHLLADPKMTVLDVRTPEEYAAGHFQGAQNINLRAVNFSQQVSKLDPQARYVLYCTTGNCSGLAAVLMQQQGIAYVINAGGYSELKAAGAK